MGTSVNSNPILTSLFVHLWPRREYGNWHEPGKRPVVRGKPKRRLPFTAGLRTEFGKKKEILI